MELNAANSGVEPCVLPQQVDKEDGAGEQEEDGVEEEGDDHPGEARLVGPAEVPVKLGRVAHWRVGAVGEPLRRRRTKDKDKSGKGPSGLDSRRHTVAQDQPKLDLGQTCWIWDGGASHTALLHTFLHWFISYFNSSVRCTFILKSVQNSHPVAPLQPGYHYALQPCGMFN